MASETQSTDQLAPSRWVKCISGKGNMRGVAIQATRLVQEMVKIHGVRDEAANSLGEAVMGALLLSSYCKGTERINLNIRGSGRVRQALVDAHPDGTVRGYVIERTEGEPDWGDGLGPWGKGMLSVLRTKGSGNEAPYIGTVSLVTGHLAKDLTFYWVQSEQIPSSVGLIVKMKDGLPVAAGGFLVQVLPGATAAEIKAVEQHIHEMGPLIETIAEHENPTLLLSQIFQDTSFFLVEEKPLEFRCSCSWERVNRALALVGAIELKSMLEEEGKASIRCDFCTKQYNLDKHGLEGLIAIAEGRAN
jgi:molecular chaperone Hsp33